MRNPFEEVEPLEELNPLQRLTQELSRSMMWDIIGPQNMANNSPHFGLNPASMDVLEAEAADMWKRKNAIAVFGSDLPLFVSAASEAASNTFLKDNPNLQGMPEEAQMQFRMDNLRLTSLVTAAVMGHMLQKGLIKYGDRYYELLGK